MPPNAVQKSALRPLGGSELALLHGADFRSRDNWAGLSPFNNRIGTCWGAWEILLSARPALSQLQGSATKDLKIAHCRPAKARVPLSLASSALGELSHLCAGPFDLVQDLS